MRPRDYIEDLAWVLTRRTSWKGSEIQGLAQRFRRMPRCYLGLHYPSWDSDDGGYYDPAWECGWCEKKAYPVRLRITEWFWAITSPIWIRYYKWRDRNREQQ